MNSGSATLMLVVAGLFAMRPGLTAETTAPATEPGETWEITSSMEMAGMSMAPHTQQVCQPLAGDQPAVPQPDDKSCEMYDVQRSGSSMSWKMRCTGKDAMTGSGELSYQGRDSYQGKMTMNMEGQTVITRLSGKRLGAQCDAGAIKKQIAAVEKQTAATLAQQCREAARSMQVMMFDGRYPTACDAKTKAEFCKRVGTEQGYDLLAARGQAPGASNPELESAGKTCGVDIAATRKQLCKAGVGKDASLPFLARHCPDEAAPIAQAQCAGRSFTSQPEQKYREFCSDYARHNLMQGGAGATGGQQDASGQPAPQEQTPAGNAVEEGKKALRKLLPF